LMEETKKVERRRKNERSTESIIEVIINLENKNGKI
jgi:hypothetical protein